MLAQRRQLPAGGALVAHQAVDEHLDRLLPEPVEVELAGLLGARLDVERADLFAVDGDDDLHQRTTTGVGSELRRYSTGMPNSPVS